MKTKHTPGPWKNGLDTKGKPIIFQRTDDPCLTFEDINVEWQANLMLASAAPDLLDALKIIIPALEIRSNGDLYLSIEQYNAVESAKSIIAKATGE